MRNLDLLARFRLPEFERRAYGGDGDSGNGCFLVRSPTDGSELCVIASDGGGWDHVSVSHRRRIPNWIEMSHVKALFFRDDECVMQLHVPLEDHVNVHARTLHLWRPQAQEIPRPPGWMVGIGDKPVSSAAEAEAMFAECAAKAQP